MSSKVSAAAALLDVLEREDVSVVFGVPGGPLLPLYDLLTDHRAIRTILVKHEQAAAYAAFAYARVTGRLGVCLATLGPGATNLLAGLPISYVGSVPILALTGQVQTTAYARGAHQESTGWFRTPNQEAMFSATCKHSATCIDAVRLPDFVRHSIRIAMSGRPGPAHLIIPSNILHQKIPYDPLMPSQYRVVTSRLCDAAAIDRIAGRIATARRPVLFLGERSQPSGAGAVAQSLGERFGIPLITDLSCKAVVDESSPMFLGSAGVLGHRAAEKYMKESSDLIVSVGQTFDEISTLSWDTALVAPERELIQLDSDPEEIGKAYPAADATVGDLATMLEQLFAALSARQVEPSPERNAVIADLLRRYPLFTGREMDATTVPLLPQRIVNEMRQALPPDALVLSDSSKWVRWLGRYYKARRGTVISAHDYEPMGWAVAGAVGAKAARPDLPVVCVSGDGAFLMSAMECSTAANADLSVIWLVMNDSRLGIIYDLQKGLYGGRVSSTTFRNPDLVQFAGAFGIPGRVITQPEELAESLRAAVRAGGSAVFDVRFDPDEIPPVRPRSLLITREMGLPNPTPGPETVRALFKLLSEK